MFGRSSGRWRWRVAGVLVALYALCLVTPTAVMALGQGTIPAHCLTDDHLTAEAVHVHHDGTNHHHSGGKTGEGDHDNKCCGLFSVSAIAPDATIIAAPRALAAPQPSAVVDDLTGRASDRIDRPPRSRLSL
jgi:hypothetical protein